MRCYTTYIDSARKQFFADEDGVDSIGKDSGSKESYTIDWADDLSTGETISTSLWECSGVTSTSPSNTTTTATTWITESSGYATNEVTTSTGRTLRKTLRFVDVTD